MFLVAKPRKLHDPCRCAGLSTRSFLAQTPGGPKANVLKMPRSVQIYIN